MCVDAVVLGAVQSDPGLSTTLRIGLSLAAVTDGMARPQLSRGVRSAEWAYIRSGDVIVAGVCRPPCQHIATTSRYSASTSVVPSVARLCCDHKISRSRRSADCLSSGKAPNAFCVGP